MRNLCHWCTAVRLAQEESEEEAQREGKADGDQILNGFREHPYIRDLARTPLMLSAICLVNYFEHGRLPEDRARLYRLCVEGLLHHWDQRRGIHSEFGLDEKLRACRTVALAIQADDKAEWEVERIAPLFEQALGDSKRGKHLLEHIRYRTGLLLERRPVVYAFAHLTFQEYLAALAIHEGNSLKITSDRLVQEHDDGRWHEVIPLYCGLTTTPMAKAMIESLIEQLDSRSLGRVLVEAWFASSSEIRRNESLRNRLLARVACAPFSTNVYPSGLLGKFSNELVAPVANQAIGTINSNFSVSKSFQWFIKNPGFLDTGVLSNKLDNWRALNPIQLYELVVLWHYAIPLNKLEQSEFNQEIYCEAGPKFSGTGEHFINQAEGSLIWLMNKVEFIEGDFPEKTWINVIDSLPDNNSNYLIAGLLRNFSAFYERKNWSEISSVLRSELASFLTRLVAVYEADSDKNHFFIPQEALSNVKAFICQLEKDLSN